MPAITWEEALEEYIAQQDYTPSTEEYWRYEIGSLARWCAAKHIRVADFTLREFLRYRRERRDGIWPAARKPIGSITLRHDSICAKAFTAWLRRNYGKAYGITRDPLVGMELPSAEEAHVRVPEPREVKKLLLAVKKRHELEHNPRSVLPEHKRTRLKRRDTALYLLLTRTAVRITEACRLEMNDVNLEKAEITVRRSKTKKVRVVPFGAEVHKHLTDWLRIRPRVKDCPFFFMSIRGEQLTRNAVYQSVKRYQEFAGIERFSVHALRHRGASDMLQSGDAAAVRDALGHASLVTTNRYSHASKERIRKVVEEAEEREPLIEEEVRRRKKTPSRPDVF